MTGGNVTFADAFFRRGSDRLFFGGFGGFFPQLEDPNDLVPNWVSLAPNTFTPLSTSATPEPGSVLALLSLGLATYGLRSRKQA